MQGLSFEFVLLHPFAYLFYCIYTISGRIDPFMATGVVTIDDVLFSTHGLLLTSVHLTQWLIYYRNRDLRDFDNRYFYALGA